MVKAVDAGVLTVGYLDHGPADGWPVILSHGFPYDVHAYDEVAPLLTARGARYDVIDIDGQKHRLRAGYGTRRLVSTR